jgi:predicted aldo/keto reductase-like oxidoreductase
MIYKQFQEVSLPALGMGAMRFDGSPEDDYAKDRETVDCAMSNGINFFDTAYAYGKDGASEKCLGVLLAGYPRQSYYISTKYMIYAGDDVKSVFEEQLDRLKTDYIDFYMIHGLGDDTCQRYIDNGSIEYFSELKQQGRIKYFGFSSHAGIETLARFADYRSWDFAMIQLNYYDWLYGQAKHEYETLNKRGIPIIAMEPIRGGRLASLSPEAEAVLKSARPDWSVASWFFRWVKTLPDVQLVLSGMKQLEHMKENSVLFSGDGKLSGEDEKLLFEACEKYRKEVSVLCTSCNYCINDCPAEIDIPEMIDLYNYLKTDKPWDIKSRIERAGSKGKPAGCTGCGICLSRCPQKIDVVDIMRQLV